MIIIILILLVILDKLARHIRSASDNYRYKRNNIIMQQNKMYYYELSIDRLSIIPFTPLLSL